MNLRDTIVALSTPLGRSGLGVVRLSGPEARDIAARFLRLAPDLIWKSWSSHFASLIAEDGALVDQVVVSFFAGPRSYTSEDVVEIACHGSPVVLRFAVEQALHSGARLADPGEFTLRAFLNGRIDLPQAEAIRELIDATTLYQARVAAQQVEGSVSRRFRPLKEQLLELIALLEAGIDFAEDDVTVATPVEVLRRLQPISDQVRALTQSFQSGRLVFEGLTLTIAGRPNVGKSSLFNRLLERDRAIVTDIPGTTRDTVSETTSLAGIPIKLIDTAGIRETMDLVETLGVERSHEAMAEADLTLLIVDLSERETSEDTALYEKLRAREPLIVGNKSDLPIRFKPREPLDLIRVSAVTGEGIGALREAVLARLAPAGLALPESGAITSLRHAGLLEECQEALANARRAVEFGIPHEMLLLDLYAALQPVDAITGATTADDILNRIFSTFCIGK